MKNVNKVRKSINFLSKLGSATQKMHEASIFEIQKFFVKVYELGNGVIEQPHFYACSVSFSQAPSL